MSTFIAPTVQGRLMSCRAASVVLDVSDDAIRRWAGEGRLQAVRIGKRLIKVSEVSVQAMRNGGAV